MITNTAGYRIPRSTADKVHARSKGRCEGQVAYPSVDPKKAWIRCMNRPKAIHHCVTKGRGGHLLDKYTIVHLLDLCDSCHRFAHSNGLKAYELGMLIDGSVQMNKVAEAPVYTGTHPLLTEYFGKDI